MTEQQVFQLEQLYVAVKGQDGQGLQILAQTPGVTKEQVVECIHLAQLMPPIPAQRTETMPGSLGFFRGTTIDYIIGRAQQGPNGIPQVHYLLAPAAMVRRLGGNLRMFEKHAAAPIPQFAAPRTDLPLLNLNNPQPPDENAQADDLLALLGYANNKIKLIEALLAGLIQGMGLSVINAPLALHDRLLFVQGLLTLLPLPARSAITFATSVIDPSRTNTQIKFLANDTRLPRHLSYDWAAGKLLDEAPDDVYTKYIMAQLRLDTSLVIQKTDRMARTAVWRAMRKDDMAQALGWAARRSGVDDLVDNGQPADPKMMAAILREDPTLPDEERIKYSRLLLSMALVSEDLIQHADIIPEKAAGNRELSSAVFDQLKAAADNNQTEAVYRLVERWMTEESIKATGVDVSRWRPLAGFAALARTKMLLAGDPASLIEFLNRFLSATPDSQLQPTIEEIIRICRARAYENAEIARIIFLLAVRYFEAGDLQRLLNEPRLMMQLPEPLRSLLPYLQASDSPLALPVSLAKAAGIYGPDQQPYILARLVEWVLQLQRPALIDTETMRSILKIAAVPMGERFDLLYQHIEEDLGQLETLKTLDSETPQYLVQLNLLRGYYPDAIRQLETYQANLYQGPGSVTILEMIRATFCNVPLDEEAFTQALQAMQDSRLEPAARASAYIGALEAKGWSPKMAMAAHELTDILSRAPHLTEQLGMEPVFSLLKANADRRDVPDTMQLANALVGHALPLADKGTVLVCRMYPVINWGPDVAEKALDTLRLYVRGTTPEQVKALSDCLVDPVIPPILHASNCLRSFVGGSEGNADFMAFAERVQAAASLLIDMAATYHPHEEIPAIWKLKRMVEAMPGGLSDEELNQLADNLNMLGIQSIKLARLSGGRKRSTETDTHRVQLLRGEIPPATSLDALYWIGGHFAEGQFHPLDLRKKARPQLLGERSINMMLRETSLMVSLFEGMLMAFPEKAEAIDLRAWKGEVEGLWGLLPLGQQRYIQNDLAQISQHLAQVIKIVGDAGHERSFENRGFGEQLLKGRAQPRTVCDALRWLGGYFGGKHK